MTEYERTIWIIKKMIADSNKQFEEAVKHEQYSRAGDLGSYINGMNQILVVVEQSKLKDTELVCAK